MRPQGEAPQLLQEVLGRDDRHRPADVLCIPSLTLSKRLPDGSSAVRTEQVCLDFAVINALGPTHWAATALGSSTAANLYDGHKRRRNGTEDKCRQANLQYWPVVHEAQGGMSKGADAAMRAIADAIAASEGRDADVVRTEMAGRIAVWLARCNAASIKKRSRKNHVQLLDWIVAAQLGHGSNDIESGDFE